jgi:hypothetical protein
VSKSGIATNAFYPYKGLDGSCKNSRFARNKVVSTGTPAIAVSADNVAALKTALGAKPITIEVDATTWKSYGSGIVSGCKGANSVTHVAVVVGYDALGNWKAKNSWGATWGEAGYIILPAAGNLCGMLTHPVLTNVN